ncbi:MAG: DUF373 family protein [Methanocorpusculum parvum]|nr:DUF373 family protein [Methanocorpusculum parvum]
MSAARTLILSVDRDDDVGYKAGVDTPAIGRDACLDAAVKLGTADPEDSDTNAIFQAIKTYDDELAKGRDVEVAVISGNHLNMLEGDRRVARLLEEVIEKTGVTECILISDGAEDEYILPIIQSRLKVAGIVRVVIKQLPNIEGTYYIIKKLMNDPKIARTFLVPLGALLLIGALAALFLPGLSAFLVVAGIVGIYLLFKGFGLDDYIGMLYHGLVDSLKSGRVSAVSYIGAAVLVLAGLISGLMSIVTYYPNTGNVGFLYNSMTFLYGSLVWFAAAALVAAAGKITDSIQNNLSALYRTFVIPFFVIAIGMMGYGFLIYFLSISPLEPFPFTSTQGIIAIIGMTLGGLAVASLGMYFRPVFQRKMEARQAVKLAREAAEAEGEKTGQPVYHKVKY